MQLVRATRTFRSVLRFCVYTGTIGDEAVVNQFGLGFGVATVGLVIVQCVGLRLVCLLRFLGGAF